MKKPKPITVSQLDWSECIEYLEKKYDFESRNYAKSSYSTFNTKPYLDFWHYICDSQNPSNGGTIYFDKDSLDICKFNHEDKDLPKEFRGWREKIIGYILNEFGEGKNKQCEFKTEW
jgi:hypothetical protein